MKDIEAYPLTWPPGRIRTPRSLRKQAIFRGTARRSRADGSSYATAEPVSMALGISRLKNEMRKLHADNLLISTDVPTRLDGLPFARARLPDDPGCAVYFRLCMELLQWSHDQTRNPTEGA